MGRKPGLDHEITGNFGSRAAAFFMPHEISLLKKLRPRTYLKKKELTHITLVSRKKTKFLGNFKSLPC